MVRGRSGALVHSLVVDTLWKGAHVHSLKGVRNEYYGESTGVGGGILDGAGASRGA